MSKIAEIETNLLEGLRLAFEDFRAEAEAKYATDLAGLAEAVETTRVAAETLIGTVEGKVAEAIKAGDDTLTEATALARTTFDQFRLLAEEKYTADVAKLAETIEAKLIEGLKAGAITVNEARECLAETKQLVEEARAASIQFGKDAETFLRESGKTVSGWFDLAEEKMLDRIEERVTALFSVAAADARTAEALRDGRSTEAQLLVTSALRDLDAKSATALDRIRTAADKLIADAEATSRTLVTIIETGQAQIEDLQGVESLVNENVAVALAAAEAKMGEAIEAFQEPAAEAIDLWRREAGELVDKFTAHLTETQQGYVNDLTEAQRSTIAELRTQVADRTAEMGARFETLEATIIGDVKESLDRIATANIAQLSEAQAIIDKTLEDISASVELHVAAMLGAEVDKALSSAPASYRGERGEPGEPGEPGPPGPPGERGERGLDGTSIGFVGIWGEGREYRPGDVVMENGSTWLAKRKTHAENPTKMGGTENPPWTLIAQRGIKGERGLRGERGERGVQGPPGAPASPIIDMAFVDEHLALVLEDGTLIKAKFDAKLIKRIAAFAAKIVKGEAEPE
jgi:hypothetical protein